MGVPHVNSFCFCCGLDSGTRIIGFLHTASAIAVVVYMSILAVNAQSQIGTIEDIDGTYGNAYKLTTTIAITGSFHIVLGAALLYAAYKRITRLLRTWVLVMMFLYAGAVFFVIVVTIIDGPNSSGSDLFFAFLQGTAFFAAVAYAILCVNSYYMVLKSDEDMCGPANQ